MRVIVTRPAAQALLWVPRLRALGVDAVSLPLLGIEPASDPAALHAAWGRLDGTALVMFVSANAVSAFFNARPAAMVWPADCLAGATGPGTSAALRAAGVPDRLIVEPDPAGPFDSEALWQRLASRPWAGYRVLVVRGEGGRDWLAHQLRLAGAQVDFVAAYRRVVVDLQGAAAGLARAARAEPLAHCWHFSSSEAIDNLVQASMKGDVECDWSHSLALVTHPRIGEAARRAGFGQVEPVGVHPQDVAAHLRSRGTV